MRTVASLVLGWMVAWSVPLLAGCAGKTSPGSEQRTVQLDHIVFGIANLEQGRQQLEGLTGIRPAFGGVHPTLGTHNALIALGRRQYVEILAPRPEAELRSSYRYLRRLATLTPVRWAVAVPDIDRMAARLRARGYDTAGPYNGSRRRPDGAQLRWRILLVREPSLPQAPFFIQWRQGVVHPAESSPTGCRLDAFALLNPQPDALRSFLRIVELQIDVIRAAHAGFRVALDCPKGKVQFGMDGNQAGRP